MVDHFTEELKRKGKSLIIDCHSFPEKPFPYEEDQSLERPDICIGTDSYHSPQRLVEKCVRDCLRIMVFR